MAPSSASTEHIKLILAKLEDVLKAYNFDCQQQQQRQQQLARARLSASTTKQQRSNESVAKVQQQQQQHRSSPTRTLASFSCEEAVQTPQQSTSAAPTGNNSILGSVLGSRRRRRRGLLGRLLRQCLPAGLGTKGSGDSKPKIQVPLGWASAVTFNWRRQTSNVSGVSADVDKINDNSGGGGRLLHKRLKRCGLSSFGHHEPVVLIGRRARHSTILMARARRLRRSLPAKLRRQLEGLGNDQADDEEDDEEQQDKELEEFKQHFANNAQHSQDDLLMAPIAPVDSVDVIESSLVTDEGAGVASCAASAAGVAFAPDSEQLSVILATPQRRELDAEVRKIEEEIKNVRQQLEQPESESPLMPTTPPPRRQLLVTSSGLDPSEVAQLRRLCENHSDYCAYQARFQFDPACHTTHVVIRESGAVRVSERTLKYFQALVSGAWLLSFDWVSESLASGSLQPESNYEIQGDLSCGVNHMGPARSRRGRARCPGPSRLLEQFSIAPVGEFINMPTFALQTLVQQCGGQFVAEPELLPRRQPAGRLSVAVADQDDARFSEPRCRHLAASGDIVVLNRDWLLDSISKFRVQQLDSAEYCIAPDFSVVMRVLARQKISLADLADC